MAGRRAVADLECLDRVEHEWDELAAATSAAPYLYPGWFRAWYTWFGSGEVRIIMARRHSELVALVPLGLRGGVLHSATNPHTPMFDFVALDDDAAIAAAEKVLASGVRRVDLRFIDGNGVGLPALRAAAELLRHRKIDQVESRSPYIRCQPSLSKHRSSLSRNLRHDTERRLRRLADAGALSIEVADGTERLDALLEEVFRVEALGWKGMRGTAIASRPELRGFYTDVARWASARGWLRLAFLRLDGRAIAVQFDLEACGTYHSLKIGYDPAYESFAPGKLLTYEMIGRAVVAGADAYELLGRDDEWKRRFTHTFHERFAFSAFPRSVGGLLSWSAWRYGRPAMRRLVRAMRPIGTASG